MASRAFLPSDPQYLLEYMHDLPDECDSDSDDEFDGYLDPDDGPAIQLSAGLSRSCSLQDLQELEDDDVESPIPELSPSHSPMQGELASGSPLPSSSHTSSPYTALPSQVRIIIIQQKKFRINFMQI